MAGQHKNDIMCCMGEESRRGKKSQEKKSKEKNRTEKKRKEKTTPHLSASA